jgi:hypothetical protein
MAALDAVGLYYQQVNLGGTPSPTGWKISSH